MGQARAGKLLAVETILNVAIYQLFTVLNLAGDASIRFDRGINPTARTCPPAPYIGSTEATIYPAGGYQ
jgi:hypothetical protein